MRVEACITRRSMKTYVTHTSGSSRGTRLMARRTKGSCRAREGDVRAQEEACTQKHTEAHAKTIATNLGYRLSPLLLFRDAPERHCCVSAATPSNNHAPHSDQTSRTHIPPFPSNLTSSHPCPPSPSTADSAYKSPAAARSSCSFHPPAPAASDTAATRHCTRRRPVPA